MKKLTTEEFTKKAREVHGDKYDYSKVEYKGVKHKVVIVCPIHGDFMQNPSNHLSGAGCPICQKEHVASLQRKTTEWFLQKAHEVHGDRYVHTGTVPVCSNIKSYGRQRIERSS